VNELEAEDLTKISFNKIEDAKKMIQSLTREKGCNIVIVTLGKHGAAFNDDDKIIHVPVPHETPQAIDSTGKRD
jgi:sugar/nucleoside kinase (ribokinase family)